VTPLLKEVVELMGNIGGKVRLFALSANVSWNVSNDDQLPLEPDFESGNPRIQVPPA
jgi:hypothetical protein